MERTRAYYDAHAERLEKKKLSCELDAEETQRILAALPSGATSFLDVGCGTGHLLGKANAGLKVGVDSSIMMLRLAHRFSAAHLILGDARRLPLRSSTFEAVTCQDVIGHFRDPTEAIRELVRTCGQDGVIILTVSRSSLLSFVVSLYSRIRLRVYLRSYSQEALEKIFEVSGGSVISTEAIGNSILKLLAKRRRHSLGDRIGGNTRHQPQNP